MVTQPSRSARVSFRAQWLSRLPLVAALSCTPSTLAHAVTFAPGDIVISGREIVAGNNAGDGVIMLVDPLTGDRTVISDDTHGTGAPLLQPYGMTRAADGSLLVADEQANSIIRIDPATGNRTILTHSSYGGPGPDVGSGPAFSQPTGVKVEPDGSLIMNDIEALFRVDPLTGNRTPLSGQYLDPTFNYVPAGGGAAMGNPMAFAVAPSGDIFVRDVSSVLQVDPVSGIRSFITDTGHGGFVFSTNKGDIAFDPAGQLFLSDSRIYGLDLATTASRIVSGGAVGTGPTLFVPTDVARTLTGQLLVPDNRSLLSIDPLTGNRVVLSSSDASALRGSGPALFPNSVLVVPEPGTALLAALGALLAGILPRRKRAPRQRPQHHPQAAAHADARRSA